MLVPSTFPVNADPPSLAALQRVILQMYQTLAGAINFTQTGPTTNRPVSNSTSPLTVGEVFFDTTLGYPVFWNGTKWVNASGTPV